ncbi:MAG: hypothetical protein L6W00_12540 [Lentisphaeria bacterium]|nr:MAG: hypothetical protein L6W00_12540 [Lentisphaeria bacterium]
MRSRIRPTTTPAGTVPRRLDRLHLDSSHRQLVAERRNIAVDRDVLRQPIT